MEPHSEKKPQEEKQPDDTGCIVVMILGTIFLSVFFYSIRHADNSYGDAAIGAGIVVVVFVVVAAIWLKR